MKNQILIAMVLVSVGLTKTLSHSIKNKSTQKHALLKSQMSTSSDFLEHNIEVNVIQIGSHTTPHIDLGYAIDATDFGGDGINFITTCFRDKYVEKHHQDGNEKKESYSSTVLIEENSDSLLKLTGSLTLTMDVEVATIAGTAAVDMKKINKKDSRQCIAKTIIPQTFEKFDIDYVEEADIRCKSKFTHIVTRIVYGKMFTAKLTSETKSVDSKFNVVGDLTATMKTIPIGGTGNINFDNDKFKKNFNFNADVYASGKTMAGFIDNIDDFVTRAKSWKAETEASPRGEDNVILSYTLEAISTYKEFGDRTVMKTPEEQKTISLARPIYNQMQVKFQALNYLKGKLENSKEDFQPEITTLKDLYYGQWKKNQDFAESIKNGPLTVEMINKLDDDNVSTFKRSDFFKTLSKKIEGDKMTIQDGKYKLKFGGNYLTTNKSVDIELSPGQEKVQGKEQFHCESYTHSSHYEKYNAADEVNYFPRSSTQPSNETKRFQCNIKSNESNFDDGLKQVRDNYPTGSRCYLMNPGFYENNYYPTAKKQMSMKHLYTIVRFLSSTSVYTKNEAQNKPFIKQVYQLDIKQKETHTGLKYPLYDPYYFKTLQVCATIWHVQPEYKGDLPYFHIIGKNQPMQKMHYSQKSDPKIDPTWTIKEVKETTAKESKKRFSIAASGKMSRHLCMYKFKDDYSLVIDNVLDSKSNEECQWYKEEDYLMNFKHDKCITARGASLTGYTDTRVDNCAMYTEEKAIVRLLRRVSERKSVRRLLKKSNSSYR